MQRRLDQALADVAELEKERAGLISAVARLREQTAILASQVAMTP